MPEIVEEIAYGVGSALVSPGLGFAELVVAAIVALAFAAGAVQSWFSRHADEEDWRSRRF